MTDFRKLIGRLTTTGDKRGKYNKKGGDKILKPEMNFRL